MLHILKFRICKNGAMTLFERSCDWAGVHLLKCSIYEREPTLFRVARENIHLCCYTKFRKVRETLGKSWINPHVFRPPVLYLKYTSVTVKLRQIIFTAIFSNEYFNYHDVKSLLISNTATISAKIWITTR